MIDDARSRYVPFAYSDWIELYATLRARERKISTLNQLATFEFTARDTGEQAAMCEHCEIRPAVDEHLCLGCHAMALEAQNVDPADR